MTGSPPDGERSPFSDGTTAPFGTERLTVGRASVVVAPVADAAALDPLVAAIGTISGIDVVEVETFEDDEALLSLVAGYPVLLVTELRRVLRGRVTACTAAGPGGRVVIDARRPPPEPQPEPATEPDEVEVDQDAEGGGGAAGDPSPAQPGVAGGPAAGAASPPPAESPPRAPTRPPTPPPPPPAAPRPSVASPPSAGSAPTPSRGHEPASSPASRPAPTRAERRAARRARSGRSGASPDPAGSTSADPGGHTSQDPGGPASPRPAGPADAGPDAGIPDDPFGPGAVAAAFSSAIDETPGLSVLVFDADLRVRAVSGIAPGEADASLLLGRPVVHAFPRVARPPLARALQAVLAGQERTVALPDEDGVQVLSAACRPLGAPGTGGVCVVRALESRSDRSLLVEVTRAFEIVFRHSPIGHGLVSPTGEWLRVNTALAQLVGRPVDALVGTQSVEILHAEARDAAFSRLRALADGAQDHYVVESALLHADGHAVRVHTRMSRVTDEDGSARGFVVQLVDAAAWRRFRGD